MRPKNVPARAAAALLAALLTPTPGPGAAPPPGDAPAPKPPADEFKAFVKEVEEAYKAPHEVDKDVLDELRKQYKNPTPEREAKILREVRRLYHTTPRHEEAILREVRRAYDRPTAEQEGRVFEEVRRLGRLPLGTVPADAQAGQAAKLFAKFDRDGNGALSPAEVSDALRGEWRRWDRNRDGEIDPDEYATYYRTNIEWVGEGVARGEIPIKLPKGAAVPDPAARPANPDPAPPAKAPPPKLPAWFVELDADRDGQVQLHEWRKAGRPIPEFVAMDLNGDGLLPPDEYRRYVLQVVHAEAAAGKAADPMTGTAARVSPKGGGK
jgi:hypothetical protein